MDFVPGYLEPHRGDRNRGADPSESAAQMTPQIQNSEVEPRRGLNRDPGWELLDRTHPVDATAPSRVATKT